MGEREETNAHVMCFQEHCTVAQQAQVLGKVARAKHCGLELTPPDETTARPTAGVGIIGSSVAAVSRVKPVTVAFEGQVAVGRAGLFLCHLGLPAPVRVVVVYAWTGSQEKPKQMLKTRQLLRDIVSELAQAVDLPTVVCGDFNCDAGSIPEVANMLDCGAWHDIGANPLLTGERLPVMTCLAHGGGALESRRDYVYVDTRLMPHVVSHAVLPDRGFDVHKLIRVGFRRSDVKINTVVPHPEFLLPQD
eukprot:7270699-Alexandrium_andersonii.AAC.1